MNQRYCPSRNTIKEIYGKSKCSASEKNIDCVLQSTVYFGKMAGGEDISRTILPLNCLTASGMFAMWPPVNLAYQFGAAQFVKVQAKGMTRTIH